MFSVLNEKTGMLKIFPRVCARGIFISVVDGRSIPWYTSRYFFVGNMRVSRRLTFLCVLRISVAIGFLLLGFRMVATGTEGYFFLLWNLFLAAIPYAISIVFERAHIRSPRSKGGVFALFALWLFFFPNAPYIMTDFIHLPWEYAGTNHFMFDFSLVAAFTFSGFLFGAGSLFRIHRTLRRMLGAIRADMIAVSAILLSGIGIYLGRFLRWNSWDILLNPLDVLRSATSHYGDPAWFLHAVLLSLLFSLGTGISYGVFLGVYRFLGKRVED